MSSAQLLKTTILQNAMLYRMANKPSHMIFAGSSGSTTVKKSSGTGKWMDTINACPNLQALITDKSDKNAVNDSHTQQNVDVTNGAIVIHTQRLKSDPGVICSPDSGELMVTLRQLWKLKSCTSRNE